jgi:hypothetical protein
MKYRLTLMLFFLVLICCKENYTNYKHLVIGEWNRPLNLELEAPPPGFNDITYIFDNDSVYYSPGLYKIIDKNNEIIKRKYIGSKLKYNILKDTLIFYFPSNYLDSSNFNIIKYQIKYLSPDTLILKTNDCNTFIYKKIVKSKIKYPQ